MADRRIDVQTDRKQTDRKDRQTERRLTEKTDGQIGKKLTEKNIHRYALIDTDKEADQQKKRDIEKEKADTRRFTAKETDRKIDRRNCTYINTQVIYQNGCKYLFFERLDYASFDLIN